jgi:drug/metabolite transporter (DMT)-like permease
MMAALLYLGSGVGLMIYRQLTNAPGVTLPAHEWPWLIGGITAGGIVAPVLLMLGLSAMPASAASLLLNAEGVFTTLLAWFVFKENFDRRIAIGMLFILAGAVALSWPSELEAAAVWPSLAALGACFAWGIDNNLTRKVALNDAAWIAMLKGMAAGSVNLALAIALGASLPSWPNVAGAMTVGFFAYGVSLALFVVGLRHLGTARTGAYFSVAPFFGAILAVAMGEPVTPLLVGAGLLMAIGIWLHLTERHAHPHHHEPIEHDHEHTHDDHHQHDHDHPVGPGVRHKHRHRHQELTHTHAHFPDAHHRHGH